MKKCIIVSGAPDYNVDFLKKHICADDYIIAADSGYVACEKIGIIPSLIIGDFDSAKYPNCDTEIIKLNVEKAHTDTFSCVIEAINRGFDDIQIFNALGSRFDHTFANVLMLSYCLKNGASCKIINEHNCVYLVNEHCRIYKNYNSFSLFAFLEDVEGLIIKGAYYDAGFYDKSTLDLKQDDLISQCNFVKDEFAEISIKKGTLLVVESND